MQKTNFNRGGVEREKSLKKLRTFLQNPGRFSLLVLGGRGSGKKHAVQECYREIRSQLEKDGLDAEGLKELCFYPKEPFILMGDEIPENADGLDKLSDYNNATVVISDVHKASPKQQELLFRAMSTSNGLFGVNKKCYVVRMVFISYLSADYLRTDSSNLIGRFWDRISQLIVRMPSYHEEPSNVIKDFNATWEKMSFPEQHGKEIAEKPHNTRLQVFLENNAVKLEGGFRDLDKIAVLYYNYRLMHYGDEKKIKEETENLVVNDVKEDFWKLQLKEDELESLAVFRMDNYPEWKTMQKEFKGQFYKWAKSKYKTDSLVEKNLGISRNTYKTYKKLG